MLRARGMTARTLDEPTRTAYLLGVSSPDLFSYTPPAPPVTAALLPDRFQKWFAARGWSPREHQLALLAKARDDRSALLIAPTGAGKTLAGFLPTPGGAFLAVGGRWQEAVISTGRGVKRTGGLHTLYISPLKALAVDIARNLETPIAEMGLPIKVETRTGDTPVSRRQRQRRYPPDILLTTPEQLALLLSSDDAPFLFGSLKRIVLDELHALVTSKRGDLLSLGLARLWRLAPDMRAIGLSATVAEPESLARFLMPQPQGREVSADIVVAGGAAAPIVEMLDTQERLPWAGHTARHALGEMYDLIRRNKTTLVFVNTRSQAEMLFQDFWRMNDDGLAIALHHGSLDVAQRRKVEDAMAAGKLRGVVCTSSLDLGIDWGDIDLVINVGAPKGASRLMQRIGRANHRLDEPSRAVLIPANRFEVLECAVAIEAIAENAQDTPPLRTGGLDVLAQHVLGCACGEPFLSDELYEEVLTAAPYSNLTRTDFDDIVDFVATGGYALKSYERFARIKQDKQGRWRVANPKVRQSYRLNVGTIVEEAMLKVKLVRSRGGGSGLTGMIGARRQDPRRDRGIFYRGPRGRRYLCVRRRDRALRGAGRGPGLCLPRQRQGRQGAVLYGRQISAVDLSGRTRPQTAGRSPPVECAAGTGARLAVAAAGVFPRAGGARTPDRNLSARGKTLFRLLSLRGTPRAPDARHAADAPAGARPRPAARLCRQRICAGDLGRRRHVASDPRTAGSISTRCSIRTCWATTSRRGLPNPR